MGDSVDTGISTTVTEIADGIHRFCTAVGDDYMPGGFEFNQFLIVDERPLLYQTGTRAHFPSLRAAMEQVMPLERLRYIAFSHIESDESGAVNLFLEAAPEAVVLCNRLARTVGLADMLIRPPQVIFDGDIIELGRHRVQWFDTPHFPHGWEAGILYEQTTGTLFCGDVLTRMGAGHEPVAEGDEAARTMLDDAMQAAERAGYIANPAAARRHLERLAALEPKLLAPMHGGAWRGEGGAVLRELAERLDALAAAGA